MLYDGNVAVVGRGVGEADRFSQWTLTGVLQGCPLSGLIFARAIDQFSRCAESRVDSLACGVARACADDVGAVAQSIYFLKEYLDVLQAARRASGLMLNTKKCALIPSEALMSYILPTKLSCGSRRTLQSGDRPG